MELKNGKICDYFNSSCGGEHEVHDETYSLSDALKKMQEIKYIDGSLNQPMAQLIL